MSEGPTSPETGTIKEVLMVNPVTIKTLLINPDIYNITELTIKLLRTVQQLVPAGRNSGRYIKTLLMVVNSEYGPEVLEHLLEYCAYTYREIEQSLGVPKSTIHYITNRLIFLGFVEPRTVVIPFNPKTPGTRPTVWVLVGAPPKASRDCIHRYYGLSQSGAAEGPRYREAEILYNLSELGQEVAETWINYYAKRNFLEPSRDDLLSNILKDHPSMSLEERQAIVKHILSKVAEFREASK